jgi:hypothetical protein
LKNYVQVWIGSWSDGSGNRLASGVFESQGEADAWVNSNATGGGSKMYYWVLNKRNVATLISQYPLTFAGNDGPDLVASPDLYVETTDDAQDWNIENDSWQTDTNDPASVQAAETAGKILKAVSGTGPAGQLSLTISQALMLTYINLLNFSGSGQLAISARLSAQNELLPIINNLNTGKITPSEALQQYQKFVDNHPQFFFR